MAAVTYSAWTTNERSKRITISVEQNDRLPDDDSTIEIPFIDITGVTTESTFEHSWTKKEAQILYTLLGAVLGK